MFEIEMFNQANKPSQSEKEEIVNFLFNHLDQYGDEKSAIEKSIDYALKEYTSFGGFVLVSKNSSALAGAVVVNETGMKGYIPENILVYIATRKDLRGQGIGKKLMEYAIEQAKGNIALHVEPDNPARYLYEKYGFTNKYLEMRLIK